MNQVRKVKHRKHTVDTRQLEFPIPRLPESTMRMSAILPKVPPKTPSELKPSYTFELKRKICSLVWGWVMALAKEVRSEMIKSAMSRIRERPDILTALFLRAWISGKMAVQEIARYLFVGD